MRHGNTITPSAQTSSRGNARSNCGAGGAGTSRNWYCSRLARASLENFAELEISVYLGLELGALFFFSFLFLRFGLMWGATWMGTMGINWTSGHLT